MIMPFIRLLSIYVVVILAVVAIFKRDQIAELTGLSLPWTQTEQGDEAAVPVAQPVKTAPVETTATAETTPVAPAEASATPEPETTKAETPLAEPTETAAVQIPKASPAPVADVSTTQAAATDDTATRLNKARQTFWNGDMAGAEALYAALAKDMPDNADVNGEFGNVLYAQRRYSEAADAYFATGKLLVETGKPAQVMPLLNVLQAIAPKKAATLYAMMTN